MPKVTKEIEDKARAANPGVTLHLLSHPGIGAEALARGPNRNEWAIFKQKLGNDTEKVTAYEVLLPCIVWPDRGELEKLFDEFPAMPEVWAGEIVEIAGSTRLATHRKL